MKSYRISHKRGREIKKQKQEIIPYRVIERYDPILTFDQLIEHYKINEEPKQKQQQEQQQQQQQQKQKEQQKQEHEHEQEPHNPQESLASEIVDLTNEYESEEKQYESVKDSDEEQLESEDLDEQEFEQQQLLQKLFNNFPIVEKPV